MTRRNSEGPERGADLLSPTLLKLVFGNSSEGTSVPAVSDRVLALYLEGVLSEKDAATVKSAVENDPIVKSRLEELKNELQQVEEQMPEAPRPSSERLPESRRVHLGNISLKKGPRLRGDDLRRARQLAAELERLLGVTANKPADSVDEPTLSQAVGLVDAIKSLVETSKPGEMSSSYRFLGGGMEIEVVLSAETIRLSARSESDNRPISGVEISLASDVGQIVTIQTDDVGQAEVPMPLSDASLFVMAEPTLEIGVLSEC